MGQQLKRQLVATALQRKRGATKESPRPFYARWAFILLEGEDPGNEHDVVRGRRARSVRDAAFRNELEVSIGVNDNFHRGLVDLEGVRDGLHGKNATHLTSGKDAGSFLRRYQTDSRFDVVYFKNV